MTSKTLTTKEVLEHFGIAENTLKLWMKAGCPRGGTRKIKGKQGGRPTRVFNLAKLEAWRAANGRVARELEGEAVRIETPPEVPRESKQDERQRLVSEHGIEGYVVRVRQQEVNLFGKYVQMVKAGASGMELSAVARALSQKGEELRRAEMTLLDHQKQTGELVNLAETKRLFVDLASAVRERVMALPNELAPVLRDYLADPDDVGKVRDEIDAAIRHALMSLPDKLPERSK